MKVEKNIKPPKKALSQTSVSDNEAINDRPLMTKNIDGDKCPKCGAVEVDAMTPRTVYDCGSSDYDQRPNTFRQSEQCRSTCH